MPLNEKFIINLKGKSFITYEGLLDLAHQKNLKSLDVQLIQIPTKENNMTAICKATAVTDNGRFSDYGDASPQSVNHAIIPHIIRMASTRAKARALRDLTNIGMTALEEINLDEIEVDNSTTVDYNNDVPSVDKEEPTRRQIDTIKKLSDSLSMDINYEGLTKKSAGQLISKMLQEKYKNH